MKLLLVGVTGGTGRKLLDKALAAGDDVTAVARKPESVTARHDKLKVVQGDVLQPASLGPAMSGMDAILSAIGPASNKTPGTLLSEGVTNLVAAATSAGVKRFVFESGLMMTDGKELSLFGNIGVSIYRRLNYALYLDKGKAEAAVLASSLDWVIVRPPSLAHVPGTGKYIAGPRARISAARSLSHEDAADCLLRAAREAGWTRQIVNVGH